MFNIIYIYIFTNCKNCTLLPDLSWPALTGAALNQSSAAEGFSSCIGEMYKRVNPDCKRFFL